MPKKAIRSGNPSVRAEAKKEFAAEKGLPGTGGATRVRKKGFHWWPKASWSDFRDTVGSRKSSLLIPLYTALLLFLWGNMYAACTRFMGLVRVNNMLADAEVSNNLAVKCTAVSKDGHCTDVNGIDHIFNRVVEVSSYHKVPYFSTTQNVLLAPMDMFSLLMKSQVVWITALMTGAVYLIEWWFLRKKNPGLPHHEIIQEGYPWYLRLAKFILFVLIFLTLGGWLWPLI